MNEKHEIKEDIDQESTLNLVVLNVVVKLKYLLHLLKYLEYEYKSPSHSSFQV